MPSICLAWNSKHIIVQWVGIGTHTHIIFATKLYMMGNFDFKFEFRTHELVKVTNLYSRKKNY